MNEENFWNLVNKTETCWLWEGTVAWNGYGIYEISHVPRQRRVAHVIAYELIVGPKSDDTLDHLCRNKLCVRPTHLEPVSSRENIVRGNGVAGINARKTHCIKGHLLAGENIRVYRGKRICRVCARDNARARTRAANDLLGVSSHR